MRHPSVVGVRKLVVARAWRGDGVAYDLLNHKIFDLALHCQLKDYKSMQVTQKWVLVKILQRLELLCNSLQSSGY